MRDFEIDRQRKIKIQRDVVDRKPETTNQETEKDRLIHTDPEKIEIK